MTKNKTGVGEYTDNLLNAIFLLDKKNNYYLFYNSHKNQEKNIPRYPYDNVHYVCLKYSNKLLNLGLFLNLIQIQKLIDVPLDWWYSPNFNFLSLSKNIHRLLTVHDLSFELFPEFYTIKQRLWHWAIRPRRQCQLANVIITPSENTKRDLVDYYKIKPEKIKVIYPGISPDFSLTENKLSELKSLIIKKYNLPENFILFIGSIEPRKNIPTLIKAFEKLPANISNEYSLIIVGATGWKNNDIYKLATKSSISNKIKFLGYIPNNEKPAFYALSQLFVFPSYYEGFGFPIVEAMTMKTPIISSNRSSLSEISNDSVYLINPNRPDELNHAIKKIITENPLKKHLIEKGFLTSQQFSWTKAAAQWLDILEN